MSARPSDIPSPISPTLPNGTPRLALSLAELAKAWGRSVRSLQYAASRGELDIPCFRIGDSRLYPITEIEKWMQARCRADGTSG